MFCCGLPAKSPWLRLGQWLSTGILQWIMTQYPATTQVRFRDSVAKKYLGEGLCSNRSGCCTRRSASAMLVLGHTTGSGLVQQQLSKVYTTLFRQTVRARGPKSTINSATFAVEQYSSSFLSKSSSQQPRYSYTYNVSIQHARHYSPNADTQAGFEGAISPDGLRTLQ
jgi:hypothetical protein